MPGRKWSGLNIRMIASGVEGPPCESADEVGRWNPRGDESCSYAYLWYYDQYEEPVMGVPRLR